jgi:hypothetical protein
MQGDRLSRPARFGATPRLKSRRSGPVRCSGSDERQQLVGVDAFRPLELRHREGTARGRVFSVAGAFEEAVLDGRLGPIADETGRLGARGYSTIGAGMGSCP